MHEFFCGDMDEDGSESIHELLKCPGADQAADYPTKPPDEDEHLANMGQTGLHPLPEELVRQKPQEVLKKRK